MSLRMSLRTRLRAIAAIARKDALDVVVDKSKLASLLFPVVLALLWVLISRIVAPHPTTLLVYNPEQSHLEQVVADVFASSQVTQASSPDEVSAAFGPNGTEKSAGYDVGLTIPAGFEQSVQAGAKPQVSLYMNGSAVSAKQAQVLQAVITSYARAVAAPAPPLTLMTATINPPVAHTPPLTVDQYYALLALSLSYAVSLALLPRLLIEEKEKKTLRMLLVLPASFSDVLLGKALVALVLQLALSLLVVGLLGGFSGNVPLLLAYIALGASLALGIGLLVGSQMQTASAATSLEVAPIFAFLLPAIFIPLLRFLGSNPIALLIKFLPTYYLADGAYNALRNSGSLSGNLLDVGVTVGSALIILVLTLRSLRRQAAVAATT